MQCPAYLRYRMSRLLYVSASMPSGGRNKESLLTFSHIETDCAAVIGWCDYSAIVNETNRKILHKQGNGIAMTPTGASAPEPQLSQNKLMCTACVSNYR